MPARVETRKTLRFIDPWLYLAIAAAVAIGLAALFSAVLSETLVDRQVNVAITETTRLEPIALQPQGWGAVRVEVRARLPRNRWVAFEIQVRDGEDRLLGSAVKQAWRESGTWREGSESGTWSESDLRGGLDLRLDRPRTLTLAIAVLDAGRTIGDWGDGPVTFSVRVARGVADGRYWLAGFVGCSLLAVFAVLGRQFRGTPVIARTIADSEVGSRTIVGGDNRLLRVRAKASLDETRPRKTTLCLRVRNAWGELVYANRCHVEAGRSDESIRKQVHWLLVLRERGSYRFFIEVIPDAPVDWVELRVLEDARTALGAEVAVVSGNGGGT